MYTLNINRQKRSDVRMDPIPEKGMARINDTDSKSHSTHLSGFVKGVRQRMILIFLHSMLSSHRVTMKIDARYMNEIGKFLGLTYARELSQPVDDDDHCRLRQWSLLSVRRHIPSILDRNIGCVTSEIVHRI